MRVSGKLHFLKVLSIDFQEHVGCHECGAFISILECMVLHNFLTTGLLAARSDPDSLVNGLRTPAYLTE